GETPPRFDAAGAVTKLLEAFGPGNVYVELQRHRRRGEDRLNERLLAIARASRLPVVATNGVAYAAPDGRQVLDVFTCLRHHTTLDRAGRLLAVNDERHLKPGAEMAALFADVPEAVANTVPLAERLQFRLEDLGYEF